MRVFLHCLQLGLGHVSRTISLGRELIKRGHEAYFFASGSAYDLLKKEFQGVHFCNPMSWCETPDGIAVIPSTLNVFLPMVSYDHESKVFNVKGPVSMDIIHRYYDQRKYLAKYRPNIIVVDGDLLALRLAQRRKTPSVFVTNYIRPGYGFPAFLLPGHNFVERYIKNCDKIVVPDLPGPYTICQYNLGDLEYFGVEEKVEFVGSFFDMSYEKGSEEFIFASISGPSGSRVKIARETIPVLARLKQKSIASLGEPDSKFHRKIGNCEVYGWLTKKQRKECMKNARIIIFSGSHGTSLEVIKYRKPSICMPTQAEQMGNARKLEELGCSIFVERKEQVEPAIKEIDENLDSCKENLKKISEVASKFNGVKRAADIIEGLA